MNKNFVAVYSGGKDSVYAIARALEGGFHCKCLLIMVDESNGRSWGHGLPSSILDQVPLAFGFPLLTIPCSNATYPKELESGLIAARENYDVQYAVFGDLFDIPSHDNWNTKRAQAAGLMPLYPLMGQDRHMLLKDFVKAGYETVINTVNTNVLDMSFLGKVIDTEVLSLLAQSNCDICGENGEYHSLVTNGPIFKQPITVHWGERITFQNIIGSYMYQTIV